jgi:hypothetical protein
VGKNLDAALWLYITKLPKPHTDGCWSSWYLEQLVKRQKWTLLGCIHDTTKLRNNRKCPAFAIVIRNNQSAQNVSEGGSDGSGDVSSSSSSSSVESAGSKEVIVLIRGSQSSMDWSLNLNEVPVTYSYLSGPSGDSLVEGKGEWACTSFIICVFVLL